jgi:antitoxin PrlF
MTNGTAASTLPSKGQITIPKEIRDLLRLQAGHRAEFEVDRQGQLIMRPRNRDFHSLNPK